MNRAELHQLAEDRLLDAQALLGASRWAGAYHLSGFSLECALKACVLAYVERTGAIFLDRGFSDKCFKHDLEHLTNLAGLASELGRERGANPVFDGYWKQSVKWNVDSRYKHQSEAQTRELYEAITNASDGVLRWIRLYW